MEIVFADAFYFIAFLNNADAHHKQAQAIGESKFDRIVTTEYVLIESADALAETRHRKDVQAFMKFLRTDQAFEIVEGTSQLFELGITLYTERPDKKWSLTDCISFVVMKQRGISEALTHDHHFKQAGFRILL